MKVAVMGFGTVGSGVAELMQKNHDKILLSSTQSELDVKYILDIRDFPGSPFEKMMIKDFNIILNDPEVGIVVETMGGLHPAYEFVSACLNAGKSVVTSNKELIAEKGYDLLESAKQNNVNILFEASVGGGIPILRPISQCLAANTISEIAGILNGTTNFILTKMITEKMTFDNALKMAQQLGYAEKDPTADVEGFDAARKICILASLCFGKHVYPDSVFAEGITKITSADVAYAAAWGGVIKLIARAEKLPDGRISAMVSPAFVSNKSQLASTDDVFNAVLVRCDAVGDVVFYGRGAGKMPTASAVVADIIDCAKHSEQRKAFGWNTAEEGYVVPHTEVDTVLFIRGTAIKPSKTAETLSSAFGDIRFLAASGAPANELAFITPRAPEGILRSKLASVEGFKVSSVIRVTDF